MCNWLLQHWWALRFELPKHGGFDWQCWNAENNEILTPRCFQFEGKQHRLAFARCFSGRRIPITSSNVKRIYKLRRYFRIKNKAVKLFENWCTELFVGRKMLPTLRKVQNQVYWLGHWWKFVLELVIGKTSVGLLAYKRSQCEIEILHTIYYVLVQSLISYRISIYGAKKTKIQVHNKRSLRITFS